MIASADDLLTVIIVMNAAGYVSPLLPHNSGRRWSRDELSKRNSDRGTDYLAGELTSVGLQLLRVSPIGAAVVAGIFSRGIEGDLDTRLQARVDVLSRKGCCAQCAGYGELSANAGVTHTKRSRIQCLGGSRRSGVEDGMVATA